MNALSLRRLRARIEERVERDLAILDAMDGDPDLEPSLGSVTSCGSESWSGDQRRWADGVGDDREIDAGDEREPEEGDPGREFGPYLRRLVGLDGGARV